MEDYRRRIDALDAQILELLGRRFAVSRQVGEYKREHDLPVMDMRREEQLRHRLANTAREQGLESAFIEELYEVILRFSRAAQG